jgi:hypothetical protein
MSVNLQRLDAIPGIRKANPLVTLGEEAGAEMLKQLERMKFS